MKSEASTLRIISVKYKVLQFLSYRSTLSNLNITEFIQKHLSTKSSLYRNYEIIKCFYKNQIKICYIQFTIFKYSVRYNHRLYIKLQIVELCGFPSLKFCCCIKKHGINISIIFWTFFNLHSYYQIKSQQKHGLCGFRLG